MGLYRSYPIWFRNFHCRFGGHCQTAARIFAETAIHVPFIWLPTFYFWTGAFKGENFEYTKKKLREQWAMVVLGSWAIWIPATTLNFSLIPVQYSIFFTMCVSVCDKIRLSFVTNRRRKQV